jgi:hypothetical protein
MPLVHAEQGPADVSERRERARKVSPQYGEGELVKVGWARNQAEAELMAGMLLEEGVPSLIRRARGFDVPDFLAAGPRDILVAASGADVARDLLGTVVEPPSPGVERPAWVRVLATLLVVIVLGLIAGGFLTAVLR